MTIFAPALAKPNAIALPIPLFPPVTIATLSFNDMVLLPSLHRVGAGDEPVTASVSYVVRQLSDQIDDKADPARLVRNTSPPAAVGSFMATPLPAVCGVARRGCRRCESRKGCAPFLTGLGTCRFLQSASLASEN